MKSEYIEKILNEEVSIVQFRLDILSDYGIREEVDSLISEEERINADNPVWSKLSRKAFQSVNFVLTDFLFWRFKFNGTMGDNLNVWHIVSVFYSFHQPDFHPTALYEERFLLRLDVACEKFEGPEVNGLVDDIIGQAFQYKTKKQRRENAKRMLSDVFTTSCGKYPNWIQGSEWPMGKSRPMRYCRRLKVNGGVAYLFADIDTQEERVITQYY